MKPAVEGVILIEGLFLIVLGLLVGISLVTLFVKMYKATSPWFDTKDRVDEAYKATKLAVQKGLGQIGWNVYSLCLLLLLAIPLFVLGGVVMWITAGVLTFLVLGRFSLPLLTIRILKTLANRNQGFTIVDEATAKIITRGGGYEKTLIQWEGYTLDANGDVIPEDDTHKESPHPLGGLRHYGRPVVEVLEVLTHTFRRTTFDEGGELQRKDSVIDYIPLADDVYWCEVEGVDVRRVPFRLELVITAHVKNPKKALFAVANWLNTIITRTQAEARNVMTQQEYDEWIKSPQAIGNQIKNNLGAERILEDEFEGRYGVVLRDIEVRKIEVADPGYREVTLQEDRATRDRRAFELKADFPALEAGKLAISMLAQSRGVSPEAIEIKLAGDENQALQTEALTLMKYVLDRKMAIEGKSYMEVNIPGGNLESGIGALLAAFKRMPSST